MRVSPGHVPLRFHRMAWRVGKPSTNSFPFPLRRTEVVFGGQAVCGMDIRPVDSNTHLVGGQGSCAAGGRQEKQQTQRFPHFHTQIVQFWSLYITWLVTLCLKNTCDNPFSDFLALFLVLFDRCGGCV